MEHSKLWTKDQIDSVIRHYGKDPINPIGKCFDNTAEEIFKFMKEESYLRLRIVHAVCVSNIPGQEGKIGHAWFEADGKAHDTTWGLTFPSKFYREQLKASYVVEYTLEEFMVHALRAENSGPFDNKIKEVMVGGVL